MGAKDPRTQASNLPYVVAVIIMTALGIIASLIIVLARPATDNTPMIAAILGSLAPTTMALLALMKSQETHLSVNSRLDKFISQEKQIGHAEGKEEERVAQGGNPKP